MRRPNYLSPTSINLFFENQEDYYLKYLADVRPPRDPQTQPMSIGSAFDAFVKSNLYTSLFGKNSNPKYECRALFEEQVEEQHRGWAWNHAMYAFRCYKDCGAYTDLLQELERSVGQPRFEFDIEGLVGSDLGTVNFFGKPDVHYINREGHSVILDWKVNGYCSKYPTSPKKGYLKLRPQNKAHKDANPISYQGLHVNGKYFLEDIDKVWATQLAIYGWLLGEDIGSQFVVGLDQLACSPGADELPDIRIAEHRLRIGENFQKELFERALHVWEVINSDHIFRDLSIEESYKRCMALDAKSKELNSIANSNDPKDAQFKSLL